MGLKRRTQISALREQRAIAQSNGNDPHTDDMPQTTDDVFNYHEVDDQLAKEESLHLSMMLDSLRRLASSEEEERSPEELSKVEYEGLQDEISLLAHSISSMRSSEMTDDTTDMLIKVEAPYQFDYQTDNCHLIQVDLCHPNGFTHQPQESIPRLDNALVDLEAYRSQLRLVKEKEAPAPSQKGKTINFGQAAARFTQQQVMQGKSDGDKDSLNLAISLLNKPTD